MKKKVKNPSKKTGGQRSSKDEIVWTGKHLAIVENLITKLKSPEIMAQPNFEEPFIVHCDKSEVGLGAVSVISGGKWKIESDIIWFKDSYSSRKELPSTFRKVGVLGT